MHNKYPAGGSVNACACGSIEPIGTPSPAPLPERPVAVMTSNTELLISVINPLFVSKKGISIKADVAPFNVTVPLSFVISAPSTDCNTASNLFVAVFTCNPPPNLPSVVEVPSPGPAHDEILTFIAPTSLSSNLLLVSNLN